MTPRQGLPASYIRKYGVSKRAWREYRKKHGKTKKRSSPTTTRTRMARRKRTRRRYYPRRRRRKGRRKISVITLATVGNYLNLSLGGEKLARLQSGDIQGYASWAIKDSIMYLTGYDTEQQKFDWTSFMMGSGVMILGGVTKKILSAVGLSAKFSNIPVIGKYLTL